MSNRILCAILCFAGAVLAKAENPTAAPLPWSAIDGLGRNLTEAPAPRPDKFVGVFYYIWHGAHGYDTGFNPSPDSGEGPAPKSQEDYRSPYLISEILAQPADSREWGPPGSFHHWGESRWGFYLADDEWVIRRNAQLLADAGVDVIFFDITNGFTYRDAYLKICRVYEDIRAQGNRTPQVAFLAHSGANTVQRVYEDFYQKGLHSDLWFLWRGKPLILCGEDQIDDEKSDFFSVRESWAWTDPNGWFGDGRGKWAWLADTPQGFGWWDAPDRPEQISVTTAQHPIWNKGKSYHNGRQPPPGELLTEKGPYFAEQWERALEVDPEFILITQWNEWIAQRQIAAEPMPLATGLLEKGDTYFVDLSTMEFNRDIEPMMGGYGDNYYYQMVDGIRRFKGAPRPDVSGAYKDDRGDVFHRNHPGFGSAGPYMNETGRNDIVRATVEIDSEVVRFAATTAAPLTPPDGKNWMTLYLRLNENDAPHWEGFHLIANRTAPRDGMAVLERCVGGWSWEEESLAPMSIDGASVSIEIPRAMLEAKPGAPLSFDFKWSDNMQNPSDPTDWMVSGDAAPNSRFVYTFHE